MYNKLYSLYISVGIYKLHVYLKFTCIMNYNITNYPLNIIVTVYSISKAYLLVFYIYKKIREKKYKYYRGMCNNFVM